MRTIRINVYKFDELTLQVKEKVLYNKARETLTANDIRALSNNEWMNKLVQLREGIKREGTEYTVDGNLT